MDAQDKRDFAQAFSLARQLEIFITGIAPRQMEELDIVASLLSVSIARSRSAGITDVELEALWTFLMKARGDAAKPAVQPIPDKN